jgi:hypothetical protein
MGQPGQHRDDDEVVDSRTLDVTITVTGPSGNA